MLGAIIPIRRANDGVVKFFVVIFVNLNLLGTSWKDMKPTVLVIGSLFIVYFMKIKKTLETGVTNAVRTDFIVVLEIIRNRLQGIFVVDVHSVLDNMTIGAMISGSADVNLIAKLRASDFGKS